jgi:hypothetical protein
MKMPEVVQYTAFLTFNRDASTASDELMAKIIVSAKIEMAYLAVGTKSGVAQLDFSIVKDEQWDELKRLVLETGGVDIINIYPTEEIDNEPLKVSEKQ